MCASLATKLTQVLKSIPRAWSAIQVERHGSYSVERLCQLHQYQSSTSLARAWTIVLLTPLPCLAVVTLLDVIPIAPPSSGLAHSHLFWLRCFLVCTLADTALLVQLRQIVPRLTATTMQLMWMPSLAAVCGSVIVYLLAYTIGFPLPFSIVLGTPGQCLASSVCIVAVWGEIIRTNREVRKEVVRYCVFVGKQASLVLAYSGFGYAFKNVGPTRQLALVLSLPLLKLTFKNWISHSVQQVEDFRPEIIIFNVEIFHALSVATLTQTVASTSTIVLLVAADFFHACASLRRMHSLATPRTQSSTHESSPRPRLAIRSLFVSALRCYLKPQVEPQRIAPTVDASESSELEKHGLIHLVLWILENDRSILQNAGIRIRSCPSLPPAAGSVASFEPWLLSGVRIGAKVTQIFPSDSVLQGLSPGGSTSLPGSQDKPHVSEAKRRSLEILNPDRGCERVQRTLRLFHVAEFVTLVEYTEVMIPVVYCFYLAIMSCLPNRVYYALLKDLDDTTLRHNLSNVLLYAFLELVSFLVLGAVLGKQLGLSSIHQLAFVLENQWQMVQSKLLLWVVVAMQSPLEHYGEDYSFQFKWLHSKSSQ